MARPLKKISPETIRLIARLSIEQCRSRTISEVTGIAVEMIRTRFRDFCRKNRAIGKAILRSAQFREARHGNPAMLIWAGKQHLAQTDRTDVTTGGQPLQSTYEVQITPTDKARRTVRGRRRLATVNGNGSPD